MQKYLLFGWFNEGKKLNNNKIFLILASVVEKKYIWIRLIFK